LFFSVAAGHELGNVIQFINQLLPCQTVGYRVLCEHDFVGHGFLRDALTWLIRFCKSILAAIVNMWLDFYFF